MADQDVPTLTLGFAVPDRYRAGRNPDGTLKTGRVEVFAGNVLEAFAALRKIGEDADSERMAFQWYQDWQLAGGITSMSLMEALLHIPEEPVSYTRLIFPMLQGSPFTASFTVTAPSIGSGIAGLMDITAPHNLEQLARRSLAILN